MATKAKPKKAKKQEKWDEVPFPKVLVRALEDFNRQYQEGMNIRISEAVEDLGLQGKQIQVDVRGQKFLVKADEAPAE